MRCRYDLRSIGAILRYIQQQFRQRIGFTLMLELVPPHLVLVSMPALLFLSAFAWAPLVAEPTRTVVKALESFRTEGPPGWSFTQHTLSEGKDLVERYDAGQPEFRRWNLVAQNGRLAKPEEIISYREGFARQSRGGTAPRIARQIDTESMVLAAETPERSTYQAKLKAGDPSDRTALFLRAILVWHKPTGVIESFTVESTGAFSPTVGVRIEFMQTTMAYTLPVDDRPSLLSSVRTRLRGRAFWLKSLDAEVNVTYSDYRRSVPLRKP